jgi:hypothetical protein
MNAEKIDSLNTTVKALNTSKFYTVNGHGIVSFKSEVSFVANRNATCYMNGKISGEKSIDFVKELNEAIKPVLEKYKNLAIKELKAEINEK